MARITPPPWRSAEGQANALGLRANYVEVFWAVGELDALGHRLLARISSNTKIDSIDQLVGVAIMRRLVTQFVGIRHLLEASVVEQAKLGIRAQFESLLAVHYLIFGGRRHLTFHSATHDAKRESRARYFFVAAERRDIYARQVLLDNMSRFGSRPNARRKLKREILSAIVSLDKRFPIQQARFGLLRCLDKKKANRRYNDVRTWFSFGFPSKNKKKQVNSIGALAGRLGYGWEYGILYAAFSGLTHPSGIKHDCKIEGNTLELFHPYMAEAFEFLCVWSLRWQILMCMWMAKSYDPTSVPDVEDIYKKTRPAIGALKAELPDGLI